MRKLPRSESEFYQRLKEETLASIYWERLELKTDTGFPDTHFVMKELGRTRVEGTIELKLQKDSKAPNLKKLMRGDQQTNFLDYWLNGGRNRYVLATNMAGTLFLYSTERTCDILRGRATMASSTADWDDKELPAYRWLPGMLGLI